MVYKVLLYRLKVSVEYKRYFREGPFRKKILREIRKNVILNYNIRKNRRSARG